MISVFSHMFSGGMSKSDKLLERELNNFLFLIDPTFSPIWTPPIFIFTSKHRVIQQNGTMYFISLFYVFF